MSSNMDVEAVGALKKKSGKSHKKASEEVAEEAAAEAVVDEKKKKKEKKAKKEEASEEPVAVAPVDEEAASEKKKKKKKAAAMEEEETVAKEEKKKEKKRKHHEEEAVAEAEAAPASEEEKPKKKKKKEAVVEEPVPEEGEKKKKKKKETEAAPTSRATDSEEAAPESAEGEKKKKKKPTTSAAHMSADEVATYRKSLNIVVTGPQNASAIVPFTSFGELELPEAVRPVVARFTKPTPIQSQCWPAVQQQRDVIAIAQTGSGKTLGFLLPLLPHLCAQTLSASAKGPFCLILAPTRELIIQTLKVCEEMGTPCGVRSIAIYGGVPKHPQVADLRKGTHIIAATPGRLLALIEEKHCSLSAVTQLVLDEADRMLDMGFEKDIRAIIGMTPTERQTLLFSATWPHCIQSLAREFVRSPVHITIGATSAAAVSADGEEQPEGAAIVTESGEKMIANKDITQIIQVMEDRARPDRLCALLNEIHRSRKNRVLIFVLYKKETDQIENLLHRRGFAHAVSISSNKMQADRTAALESFRDGTRPLLIATDVASRGLDIPDVEYVINYSFPLTIEDYMHRIGRTGRAGKKGAAYTFFTPYEKRFAGQLIGVLRAAQQTVPEDLLAFGTAVKKKEHSMYGAFFKSEGEDSMPMKKSTRVTFD